MKQAAIIRKNKSNGWATFIMRAGAKGRGQILDSIDFQSNQPKSVEAAENYIKESAERQGYQAELIGTWE